VNEQLHAVTALSPAGMGPKGVLNLVANRSNERQVIQPQSVT